MATPPSLNLNYQALRCCSLKQQMDKKVEINKRQDGEGKRTQNWGAVDLGLISNSLSH